MDPVIADPLEDRDQFRSPRKAGRPPLVGRPGLLFINTIKLIGDHTSRDSSLVHHFGHRLVENVNISENGGLNAVDSHVTEEFFKLAGIEPDLCDQKVCSSFHFFEQLVVLSHYLRLLFLKGGDGAAFKKMGRGEAHAPAWSLSINFQPLVHLIDKMDELNGIEVKD